MKVTLINTSDLVGGAAIACHRLHQAHLKNGVNSKLLVQEKTSTNTPNVVAHQSILPYAINKEAHHYIEKLHFLRHQSSKDIRFAFSSGLFGKRLDNIKDIIEADVLHLHWVQKGFVSIGTIRRLQKLNKPIVWTLHDMWAFTGGCHYSGDCTLYQEQCGDCNFLKKPQSNDLSNEIWNKKSTLINQSSRINFVTCSKWLKTIANSSTLLTSQDVIDIPNCIDTEKYKPLERENSSIDKYTLLFQAMNINDERKGLRYLIESLEYIAQHAPQLKKKIQLLIFGKVDSDEFIKTLDFETELLGSLTNQSDIIAAYQRANIFVIPSLQDNLPNTVMESLSCGVPVAGFSTGGIPEMVDHKINGYIVSKGDSMGLAKGIEWLLEDEQRYLNISLNARKKALDNYTYDIISNRYLDLYKSLTHGTF